MDRRMDLAFVTHHVNILQTHIEELQRRTGAAVPDHAAVLDAARGELTTALEELRTIEDELFRISLGSGSAPREWKQPSKSRFFGHRDVTRSRATSLAHLCLRR